MSNAGAASLDGAVAINDGHRLQTFETPQHERATRARSKETLNSLTTPSPPRSASPQLSSGTAIRFITDGNSRATRLLRDLVIVAPLAPDEAAMSVALGNLGPAGSFDPESADSEPHSSWTSAPNKRGDGV